MNTPPSNPPTTTTTTTASGTPIAVTSAPTTTPGSGPRVIGPSSAPAARRAMTPTWAVWAVGLAAVVIGLLLGRWVEKRHAQSNQVLVAVNGATIDKAYLFTRLQDLNGVQVMGQLVQEQLQLQFAHSLGLEPAQAAVDARWDEISHAPNFGVILSTTHSAPAVYKDSLKLQMAQAAVFTQGVVATPADVQRFYALNTNPRNPNAQFYKPAATLLSVIATRTRPQIQAALGQLSADVPFNTVAGKYSVDPSRRTGGQLPAYVRGQNPLSRFPAVEASVFALNPGQQLGPIQVASEYCIFRCSEKAPAVTYPLAQVQGQAQRGALLAQGILINRIHVAQRYATFSSTANVQAFSPYYNSVTKIR